MGEYGAGAVTPAVLRHRGSQQPESVVDTRHPLLQDNSTASYLSLKVAAVVRAAPAEAREAARTESVMRRSGLFGLFYCMYQE